jgi:hypothetical protein
MFYVPLTQCREENRLRTFQNKVLMRIFRIKREEEREGG